MIFQTKQGTNGEYQCYSVPFLINGKEYWLAGYPRETKTVNTSSRLRLWENNQSHRPPYAEPGRSAHLQREQDGRNSAPTVPFDLCPSRTSYPPLLANRYQLNDHPFADFPRYGGSTGPMDVDGRNPYRPHTDLEDRSTKRGSLYHLFNLYD